MADSSARFKPVRQTILPGHQAAENRVDLILASCQFSLQLSKIDGIPGMDQKGLEPGRSGLGFQRFLQRDAQDLGQ